jgi:hypothetical protein
MREGLFAKQLIMAGLCIADSPFSGPKRCFIAGAFKAFNPGNLRRIVPTGDSAGNSATQRHEAGFAVLHEIRSSNAGVVEASNLLQVHVPFPFKLDCVKEWA